MLWKKMPIIFFFLFIMCVSASMVAYAAPKNPMPQQVLQPDGTMITIIERGDEFISWTEDLDGYLIAFDEESGYWYYAYVDESNVSPEQNLNVDITKPGDLIVGKENILPYGPQLQRSQKYKNESYISRFIQIGEKNRAANGYYRMLADSQADELNEYGELVQLAPVTRKPVLVVAVDFNDKKSYEGTRNDQYFYDTFFNTNSGVMSAANYFKDMSGGLEAIIPVNTSIIPSTPTSLGNVSWTSGANWIGGSGVGVTISSQYNGIIRMQVNRNKPPERGEVGSHNGPETGSVQLAIRTIQQHYPSIYSTLQSYGRNFSVVILIPNGGGFASNQSSPLGTVAFASSSPDSNFGTHIHEMGHATFNYPDLYEYSFVTGGVGPYCLMSYGIYGSDSSGEHMPVGLSPYLKERSGWGNIETIAPGDGWDGNLVPYNHSGHKIIKVTSDANPKQYFMLENVALEGWNTGFHGFGIRQSNNNNGGILIWHINLGIEYGSGWESIDYDPNNWNVTKGRHAVAIEVADGNTAILNGSRYSGGGVYNYFFSNTPYTRVGIPANASWGGRNGTFNVFNATSSPSSNFNADVSQSTQINGKWHNPQNVETGIDIQILGARSPDMQVKVIGNTKNYSLSFNSTLGNALGNPESVATASANAPRSNTNTTAMNPIYVQGSKAGKQAINLGYWSNTNGGTPTVNSLIDLGPDAFNYNQSFTLAFNIKIDEVSSGGTWPAIVSNKNWGSGANNGFFIGVKNNNIYINSKSNNDSARLNGSDDITIYPVASAKENFVHIAAVYDKAGGTNGTLTLYANGERVGNVWNTNLTGGISGRQRTYIGQSYNSASNEGPFNNGSAHNDYISFFMEDFLLQGGAMTATEIAALANGSVSNVPVTDVSLNMGSKTLTVEDYAITLIATVTPANATNKKVTWSSSNPTVATVNDNGEVRLLSVGTTTITVTTEDGKKTATCAITVSSDVVIRYGDVNGDGVVNAADITLLRRYLAAPNQTAFLVANPNFNFDNADVNGDGIVDSADMALLRRYLAATDPSTVPLGLPVSD